MFNLEIKLRIITWLSGSLGRKFKAKAITSLFRKEEKGTNTNARKLQLCTCRLQNIN